MTYNGRYAIKSNQTNRTKINTHTTYNRTIGLTSRVFANGLGDQGSIPDRVIPKA